MKLKVQLEADNHLASDLEVQLKLHLCKPVHDVCIGVKGWSPAGQRRAACSTHLSRMVALTLPLTISSVSHLEVQLKLHASELVCGAYVATQGWFLGGQGCVACSQPVSRSPVLGLMPAGLHPCTAAEFLTHAADSKLQMWVCTANLLEDKKQSSGPVSQHHLGYISARMMLKERLTLQHKCLRKLKTHMLTCRAGPLEGRGVWHAVSLSVAQQVLGPLRARADARLALHVPGSIPQVCPAPHLSCLWHCAACMLHTRFWVTATSAK